MQKILFRVRFYGFDGDHGYDGGYEEINEIVSASTEEEFNAEIYKIACEQSVMYCDCEVVY